MARLATLRDARWIWVPVWVFVVTRVGIALIAYIAAVLIPENPLPPPYHIRPDNLLLDSFGSRWDTGFYINIAETGYRYEGAEFPSVAFFPLLPLFIRLFTYLTHDPLTAGLIVSNLALLLASIVFYQLVALEGDAAIAERALWYLLIFPASFFGSAIYSESLFLLCAIGALYLARRGYWESSAMLGVLASLSRFMGVIVAPLLLLEWWMQRRKQERRTPAWGVLAGVAVPFGTLLYSLYLQVRFGEPLAFMTASRAWEREPQAIWATVEQILRAPTEGWQSAWLAGHLPLDNWIDLLVALLFLGLGFALLRYRRWSEAVFVLMGTLIPLNSGLLMSQRRYMWVLFPVFILLAQWGERQWVDRLVTTFSLLGLGLFTALFAAWYWVG